MQIEASLGEYVRPDQLQNVIQRLVRKCHPDLLREEQSSLALLAINRLLCRFRARHHELSIHRLLQLPQQLASILLFQGARSVHRTQHFVTALVGKLAGTVDVEPSLDVPLLLRCLQPHSVLLSRLGVATFLVIRKWFTERRFFQCLHACLCVESICNRK